MTMVEELAEFVVGRTFDDLSSAAVAALKVRMLDGLGCALGALEGPPILALREHAADFGGRPLCTTIGGPKTSPDRAALINGALVRYLDFNDSYLAKGETCHPSDNIGAVMAAAEYARGRGRDLLVSLAVAYQVQCRLSDVAPVRAKGFDHTTQGSYAVAAGVSKALRLDPAKTANAIAISGTAFNALRVTRTGTLSNWKGLAYPNTGFCGVHAAFLAKHGITGPPEVFEGNKGFMDAIAGKFEIDWSREDLERVTRTILKRFNAEVHSQSATEGILELKAETGFTADQVDRIDIDIFDVAYNIIGGGEEGSKYGVRTKEEADHSLQYIVSAAILDGNVLPSAYTPERILRKDIQELHRKIVVRPKPEYSARFPAEMPCRLTVHLKEGRVLEKEKRDYEGFVTRPMAWATAEAKFHALAAPFVPGGLRTQITKALADLENIQVVDLLRLLAKIPTRGKRRSP
ncbi:MAG TPA: MmgE/PrpD family protein [Thermoplasmata archaeon]|nr:MmgE/PrpD family protein [Thermoplasmata archaeon]